jgi:hypothetical protein
MGIRTIAGSAYEVFLDRNTDGNKDDDGEEEQLTGEESRVTRLRPSGGCRAPPSTTSAVQLIVKVERPVERKDNDFFCLFNQYMRNKPGENCLFLSRQFD